MTSHFLCSTILQVLHDGIETESNTYVDVLVKVNMCERLLAVGGDVFDAFTMCCTQAGGRAFERKINLLFRPEILSLVTRNILRFTHACQYSLREAYRRMHYVMKK